MFSQSQTSSIASDNETDGQSFSLPSLCVPNHLDHDGQRRRRRGQLDGHDGHDGHGFNATDNDYASGITTMKEFDAKINDLRRENFQLKLRIYFMEQERNGGDNRTGIITINGH